MPNDAGVSEDYGQREAGDDDARGDEPPEVNCGRGLVLGCGEVIRAAMGEDGIRKWCDDKSECCEERLYISM